MTYEIKMNPEFNSLEVYFSGKPEEAVREALKTLRFRWHKIKKCWYGFAEETAVRKAIDSGEAEKPEAKAAPKAKKNKYGVEVGDLFSASWGYDQTQVDFFQVIELVGQTSVRVRAVYPEMVDENPTCSMAADRTYKMTKELLPPATHTVFIKDQEHGDLKRIKPGYYKDEAEANRNCFFVLSSFANAYKCNGETETTYESWYR